MDSQYNAIYQSGTFRAIKDLNIRLGAPTTAAPTPEDGTMIHIGQTLSYTGWVENGEVVKGISKWFFDEKENFYWSGNCEDLGQMSEARIISNEEESANAQEDEQTTIQHPFKLIHGKYYGPTALETIDVREYIDDEFHHKTDNSDLQCTEYAYYRLKCAGIAVEWKEKDNRHGGLWPEKISSKYNILDAPIVGSIMSIPVAQLPPYGHVAYVEKVNEEDGSIDIFQANWWGPNKDNLKNNLGHYWEHHAMPASKWRGHYKAKFINFNS